MKKKFIFFIFNFYSISSVLLASDLDKDVKDRNTHSIKARYDRKISKALHYSTSHEDLEKLTILYMRQASTLSSILTSFTKADEKVIQNHYGTYLKEKSNIKTFKENTFQKKHSLLRYKYPSLRLPSYLKPQEYFEVLLPPQVMNMYAYHFTNRYATKDTETYIDFIRRVSDAQMTKNITTVVEIKEGREWFKQQLNLKMVEKETLKKLTASILPERITKDLETKKENFRKKVPSYFCTALSDEVKMTAASARRRCLKALLDNNGFLGVWEELGDDGQSWLISTLTEEKSFSSSTTTITGDKKEEKLVYLSKGTINWPKDMEARQFNIHDISSASPHIDKGSRNYFSKKKGQKLINFKVMGGGDCLGYVFQLSREDIVPRLLMSSKDARVRGLFSQEIAVLKDDFSWLTTGAPSLPTEEDFNDFINHQYKKMRENLDTPVAKALGMILDFSVFIWSQTEGTKNLLLSDSYHDPKLKAEKHILLDHGHYSNLLTEDACAEEVEAAMHTELRIREAMDYYDKLDFAGAFNAQKSSSIKGPFVHRLK